MQRENGLGFQRFGPDRPATPPKPKTVEVTLQEVIYQMTRLAEALNEVSAWIASHEEEHGEGGSPAQLQEHEEGADQTDPTAMWCPECAQGKHPNCTGEVPVGDADEMAECSCKASGH